MWGCKGCTSHGWDWHEASSILVPRDSNAWNEEVASDFYMKEGGLQTLIVFIWKEGFCKHAFASSGTNRMIQLRSIFKLLHSWVIGRQMCNNFSIECVVISVCLRNVGTEPRRARRAPGSNGITSCVALAITDYYLCSNGADCYNKLVFTVE